MRKLRGWLEDGIQDVARNHWTKRSRGQYCRDLMFSVLLWPVMILRFVIEPIFLGPFILSMGIYYAVTLILKLTSGI